jgi:diadenylate cyclase
MLQFVDTYVWSLARSVGVMDVLDILLVAALAYSVLRFMEKTRAGQLMRGVGVFLIITFLSDWLRLNVLNYILINTLQVGVIALLIVFQPELRRGLEHMGGSKFRNWFRFDEPEARADIYGEIANVFEELAREKIGALALFQRKSSIAHLLTGGTELNADVSAELLANIFTPNTPLHDGAAVVRDGKILKAGVVLPLSQNKFLSKELGTRHRAALGVTEQSDAVCLAASEETGKISVAVNGEMLRNVSAQTLKETLRRLLERDEAGGKKPLRLFKGRVKE